MILWINNDIVYCTTGVTKLYKQVSYINEKKILIIQLFITRLTDNGKINFLSDRPIFLERSTSQSQSTVWRPLLYNIKKGYIYVQ